MTPTTSHNATLFRRLLGDRGFILCVITLIAGACYLEYACWGLYLVKKELPLKKPLQELDEKKLAPFKVVQRSIIENEDLLKELGTEQYIQWTLQDMQPEAGAPNTIITLFITYYTGDPGLVPHIPDVCYRGGGWVTQTQPPVTLTIGNGQGQNQSIPLHILTGSKIQSDGSDIYATIGYFFSANGSYLNDRTAVRMKLYDPKWEHAYFCKVEFTISNPLRQPDPQELVRLIEKLSRRLVPVLLTEHLPQWPVVSAVNAQNQ